MRTGTKVRSPGDKTQILKKQTFPIGKIYDTPVINCSELRPQDNHYIIVFHSTGRVSVNNFLCCRRQHGLISFPSSSIPSIKYQNIKRPKVIALHTEFESGPTSPMIDRFVSIKILIESSSFFFGGSI